MSFGRNRDGKALTTLAGHSARGDVRAFEAWVRATQADVWRFVAHRGGSGFENLVESTLLLDDLDPQRREALVLTQILGHSYAETAEISDCPIGTVRSRVVRAREDLLVARDEHGTAI
ncbi:sigma factor-like helix-turn-helix DNA-binding protein [Amycolatopsis azurea]|uniref:sigma factor-like helix-turn-helix DNA-binding protein n=1 Tax=Amycolatopsis azurea TaxID=36819 RepID=UPI00381140B5